MPADDIFRIDDFIINDDYGQIDDLPDQPELAAVNEDIAAQYAQLQLDLDAAHQKLDALTDEKQNFVISTSQLSTQLAQTRYDLEQSQETERALQTRLAEADLENVTIKGERDTLLGQVAHCNSLTEAVQNSLALAQTEVLRIPLLDEEVSILKSTLQTLSTEKQSAIDAGRERECALQNQLETTKRSQEKAISEFIAKSNRLRQDFQILSTQNDDLKQERDGLTSQLTRLKIEAESSFRSLDELHTSTKAASIKIVTLEKSLKVSKSVASKAKEAEQRLREELQHSITNLNVLQNKHSEIVATEVEKMSAIIWGEIKEGVTGLAADSEELTANINSSFNTLLSNGCTIADVFDGVQQVLTHLISVKADAMSNMQLELTAVNSRSSKRASAIQGLKEELKVETASSANRLAAIKKLEISANVSDATISSLRKDFVTVQETASLAATASDATIKSMREELQLIQDTASLEIVDLKKGFAAVSSTSVTQQKVISDYAVELQSEKEVSAGLVASFNDLKVELDSKVDACSDLTTTLGKAQESLTAKTDLLQGTFLL